MAPSHAGPAPIATRNAGSTAVAISWLQSLNRLVMPTPKTVRVSQFSFGCPDPRFTASQCIAGLVCEGGGFLFWAHLSVVPQNPAHQGGDIRPRWLLKAEFFAVRCTP